jgi:hypothetical protein
MRRQSGKRGSIYTGKLLKRGSMHRETGNNRNKRRQPSKKESMRRQTGNRGSMHREPGNNRNKRRQLGKKESMSRQTGKEGKYA